MAKPYLKKYTLILVRIVAKIVDLRSKKAGVCSDFLENCKILKKNLHWEKDFYRLALLYKEKNHWACRYLLTLLYIEYGEKSLGLQILVAKNNHYRQRVLIVKLFKG
jgi:hypothetical protein